MWPHSSTSIGNGETNRSTWPLVGRDDVLNVVAATIGQRGPGSLVLSGRPSVGRSRLLEHRCFDTGQLSALPPDIDVLPMRDLAWLLAELQTRHRAERRILSAAMVEALTAVAPLGSMSRHDDDATDPRANKARKSSPVPWTNREHVSQLGCCHALQKPSCPVPSGSLTTASLRGPAG